MVNIKIIYIILIFLFILASCTKLPSSLSELDNGCNIDKNCKLVLSNLDCCGTCGTINVSKDIVVAVNLKEYEEYSNWWHNQNCGEVYVCPECAPGRWINYEKFEARCINNVCNKVEISS